MYAQGIRLSFGEALHTKIVYGGVLASHRCLTHAPPLAHHGFGKGPAFSCPARRCLHCTVMHAIPSSECIVCLEQFRAIAAGRTHWNVHCLPTCRSLDGVAWVTPAQTLTRQLMWDFSAMQVSSLATWQSG